MIRQQVGHHRRLPVHGNHVITLHLFGGRIAGSQPGDEALLEHDKTRGHCERSGVDARRRLRQIECLPGSAKLDRRGCARSSDQTQLKSFAPAQRHGVLRQGEGCDCRLRQRRWRRRPAPLRQDPPDRVVLRVLRDQRRLPDRRQEVERRTVRAERGDSAAERVVRAVLHRHAVAGDGRYDPEALRIARTHADGCVGLVQHDLDEIAGQQIGKLSGHRVLSGAAALNDRGLRQRDLAYLASLIHPHEQRDRRPLADLKQRGGDSRALGHDRRGADCERQ